MSDINLTVSLNPEDAKQSARELQTSIEQIFDSKVEGKAKVSFMRLQANMQKAYSTAGNLMQQMHALETTQIPTQAYAEVTNQINSAKAALGKLEDDMQKFVDLGGNKETKTFKKMQYDAQQLRDTIKFAEEDMRDLVNSGNTTVSGSTTSEYQQLAEKLAQVNNQMRIYKEQAAQMGASGNQEVEKKIGLFGRLRNAIQTATNAMRTYGLSGLTMMGVRKAVDGLRAGFISAAKALPRLAGKAVLSGLKTGLTAAANAAHKLASSLMKAVKSGVQSGFSKLSNSFTGLKEGIGKFTSGLNKGFWTVLKYTVGLRSLFIVTNKVRNALKDGVKNLVQYSGSFNRSISNMLSSLTYLKNSLATAFEPLITTVAPIITRFIDTIANALSKLSQFFSALIGRTWFYKAKKVYQDYASSISSGSDAANKSAEKLQRTISGFDDVEILKEPDSDSGSGGGGGGGGASPSDMFEVAPIEGAIKSLADELKEYVSNQDWEGLGSFLGEKINGVFQKAYDALTSEALYEKIDEVTNAITTTFNSLVDAINWDLIGRTFGAGINVITHTANQILTGIDWMNLGKSIGEGLNGLFDEINWKELGSVYANYLNALFGLIGGVAKEFKWKKNAEKLDEGINTFISTVNWSQMGTTISDTVKGAFTFIGTAIEGVNWRELGEGVKKAIIAIDWNGVADAIFEAIGAAIGGIASFLVGLLSDVPKAIKDYFKEHIKESKEAGGSIVDGIFAGIEDALKSIGTWVVDHIFKPFIEGFKKAFGIASPSKVMAEQGGYIIEGLLNGIIDGLKNIGSWVKEHILDPIVDAFSNAKENLKNVGTTIKEALFGDLSLKDFSISDLVTNIKDGIKNKLTDLKDAGASIKEKIKEGINKDGFDTTGEGIGKKVKEGIKNKLTELKERGQDVRDKLKEGINKDGFETTGEGIGNKVKAGIGNAKNTLKTAGTNIKTWVKDNIGTSAFTDKGKSIGNSVKTGINNVKNNLKTAGTNIKTWIKDKISSSQFVSVGQNIISGVVTGIQNWMYKIRNAAGNIASSVKTRLKNLLGIHSPSTVFRDEVGKMIVLGLAEGITDEADVAISALGDVGEALLSEVPTEVDLPAIVGGEIIPYDVELSNKSNITNIMDSLKNLIEMLEYTQENQISPEDLELIVTRIVQQYMNIDFYIGDEQVARHANAGNERLNRRFNPVMA